MSDEHKDQFSKLAGLNQPGNSNDSDPVKYLTNKEIDEETARDYLEKNFEFKNNIIVEPYLEDEGNCHGYVITGKLETFKYPSQILDFLKEKGESVNVCLFLKDNQIAHSAFINGNRIKHRLIGVGVATSDFGKSGYDEVYKWPEEADTIRELFFDDDNDKEEKNALVIDTCRELCNELLGFINENATYEEVEVYNNINEDYEDLSTNSMNSVIFLCKSLGVLGNLLKESPEKALVSVDKLDRVKQIIVQIRKVAEDNNIKLD